MRECSSRKSFSCSPPRGIDDVGGCGRRRRAPPARRGEIATAIAASRGRPASRRGPSCTACEQRGVGGARSDEPRRSRDVARLQAERGDVDRHVRPGLVDDQHAARAAPARGVTSSPFGEPPAVDDLAARIGQRGDRARRRLGSAVEARGRRASGGRAAPPWCPSARPRRDVRRVRVEDRARRRATSASAMACSAASFCGRSSAATRPRRRTAPLDDGGGGGRGHGSQSTPSGRACRTRAPRRCGRSSPPPPCAGARLVIQIRTKRAGRGVVQRDALRGRVPHERWTSTACFQPVQRLRRCRARSTCRPRR